MNSLQVFLKTEPDQSMDASVSMFRLFMQDCQMKDQHTPLLVKEYQYLICNPKLELAGSQTADEELGQLKVNFVANGKENEQNISTTLADFRINLAFPTVKALLVFAQGLQGFGDDVMKKLGELQAVNEQEDVQVVAKDSPKVAKAPKAEEKPAKGKLNVDVKLANLETTIPMDPTSEASAVVKFGMSTDVKFVNAVDSEGVTKRSVDANVTSLSIVCAQEEVVESILNEMSIAVKYGESVGVDRDIWVDIKPIMVKVTFKELQFLQVFADNITRELESLQPSEDQKKEVAVKKELKESKEAAVKPKALEKSEKEAPAPKLKVVVKMDLLKFVLEDNLSKYKYPLVKMWIANMAADVLLDPVNGTKVNSHIFEIAIELGQMFNQDIENTKCYEEYFRQLPFSDIENESSELPELYRESM